jgi:hypothetical protein
MIPHVSDRMVLHSEGVATYVSMMSSYWRSDAIVLHVKSDSCDS